MADIIKELISRGQQLDAVHFTYEVGLVHKFPPVPLLKSFLKDAKKAAASILEDPNNTGRAAVFIHALTHIFIVLIYEYGLPISSLDQSFTFFLTCHIDVILEILF